MEEDSVTVLRLSAAKIFNVKYLTQLHLAIVLTNPDYLSTVDVKINFPFAFPTTVVAR